MRHWIIFASCIALLLTKVNFAAEPESDLKEETPVCTTALQCEAMWTKAFLILQQVTEMKIQIATENILQTYLPREGTAVGGLVMKYPTKKNHYEFRVKFFCAPANPKCDEIKDMTKRLFNLFMAVDLPQEY